jgi:ATP/maltotriose-dependent transcriptional regulator MalT
VAPGRAADFGCTRSTGDFSAQERLALDVVKSFLDRVVFLHDDRSGRSRVLTQRERQVLNLAAAGASNAEIAAELVIAHGTVKKHLDNIYGKLGTANRTAAAARIPDIAPRHPLERP